MKRPGIAKVSLTTKQVGKDRIRVHRIGSHCMVERSGAHAGQFIIWFPENFYIKIDAVQLHDFVETRIGQFQ